MHPKQRGRKEISKDEKEFKSSLHRHSCGLIGSRRRSDRYLFWRRIEKCSSDARGRIEHDDDSCLRSGHRRRH